MNARSSLRLGASLPVQLACDSLARLVSAGQLMLRLFPHPVSEDVKPAHPAAPAASDAELTRTAATLLRGLRLNGLAQRVTVRWHARLSSTAGLVKLAPAVILLNPRLRAFAGETDRTLRHELAHLVVFARSRRSRRVAPHGPEWRQACAELGIPDETRCHQLPLPQRRMHRPHVYRCPRCAFVLRRARPINTRRRRLACRDCCDRHAGGRFDPRFQFERMP